MVFEGIYRKNDFQRVVESCVEKMVFEGSYSYINRCVSGVELKLKNWCVMLYFLYLI